jgi:putative ABC transport system substrate-binding protein
MRRREFVFGSVTAAILAPMASGQSFAVPVIGIIAANRSPEAPNNEGGVRFLSGVRRGLAETGCTEAKDYRFEFRAAGLNYDRLPALVQDLVSQQVALILAPFTAGVAAAKLVTQTVPIVFTSGFDPVENGFVTSLSKPGGNITGVFTINLAGKRLELLREFIPSVKTFGLMINPQSKKFNEQEIPTVQAAARMLGVDVVTVNAQKPDEFEAAFNSAIQEGAGGIIIGAEQVFQLFPSPLAELAARYRIPAIYYDDKHVKQGGLASYGADQDDSFRLTGIYAGRILKGEKPSEMPVQQATRTRLLINLKTAKALGIEVPLTLLARADEVIE